MLCDEVLVDDPVSVSGLGRVELEVSGLDLFGAQAKAIAGSDASPGGLAKLFMWRYNAWRV